MKILMLTLYLPFPPTSGGQIRSFNLIKNLSKKHEITLVSFIKKGEEIYADELRKYCKEVIYFYRSKNPFVLGNVFKWLLSLYPFVVIRNFSAEGAKLIAQKIKKEKFDLIHVETFYLQPHIPKEVKIPILLVDQTIEYQVYQHKAQSSNFWLSKLVLNIDVLKLKYWETRFWKEAARVVAVSEPDKEKMQKIVPGLSVDIIPNAPGDDLTSVYTERKEPDFKHPVVFYQSNFFWMQNVEGAQFLVKKVFPEIKKLVPSAICRIVGQMAAEKVDYLKSDSVEVVDLKTSDVEGVRKAYREGTVFVAPLWGPGGTRLKIFSAMSTGVPVVTTSVGAQGIEVVDGKHLIIADTPEKMAEAVVKLLTNKTYYSKIVTNAKKLILEKYDWKVIANDLSKIYEETAKRN